jgi:ubiquinone/menaquinone biosynthesis C-methylase UbiE
MTQGSAKEIKEHFEEVALKYDWYKKRAWYYYDWLKQILKKHLKNPEEQTILEIGCGTGDVLAYLNPKEGIGIDISENMISLAKEKYETWQNLSFEAGQGETYKTTKRFDAIIMPDVIEHLADVKKTLKQLYKICDPKTKLIITMINPVWEPILMLGEKLGKKMPEGPHNRITYGKLKKTASEVGFKVIEREKYVCFPVFIKHFSNPINKAFNKIPILRKLGLIEVIELTP